jgi:hypothetical protein
VTAHGAVSWSIDFSFKAGKPICIQLFATIFIVALVVASALDYRFG